MANENLKGLKVAILIEEGFEQVEMVEPRRALDEAGAETHIVSPRNKKVRSWVFTEWGDEFPVDMPLDKARPDDYDALLLPGGVINPDKLRMQPKAVEFVKAFFDAGKPVASICHGPGWSSRPARRAGGASPHGLRSRPMFETPAGSGWIRRWWLTAPL
jgi:protease I